MAAPGKGSRAILVAFDGSKHSVNAFDWFMRHIHKTGDLVLVAYCNEVSFGIGTALKQVAKPETAVGIQKKLNTATENARQAFEDGLKKYKVKVQYTFLPLPHPAGENLIKAAKDHHAVFIIAGSRGNNPARHTIIGSVSRFLVTHAGVPVFVCKHPDERQRLK